MATKRFIYNIFWKDLLSGGFDIDDKSYKAILLDPEYVFSGNHTTYGDVSLYELPAEGGYQVVFLLNLLLLLILTDVRL